MALEKAEKVPTGTTPDSPVYCGMKWGWMEKHPTSVDAGKQEVSAPLPPTFITVNMHLTTLAIALFSVSAALAAPRDNSDLDTPGQWKSRCFTTSGYAKVGKPSTTTSTRTRKPTTITIARTETVTKTTTPTVTTTTTSLKVNTVTKTAPPSAVSSTLTITSTVTALMNTSAVVFTTVTDLANLTVTSTTVSTVAAPAGFTPIFDSSGYSSLNDTTKRSLDQSLERSLEVRGNGGGVRKYPGGRGPPKVQGVKCVTVIQSTSTAYKTKTKTITVAAAPKTKTASVKTTMTSTLMIMPSAVTKTVNATVSTTITSTDIYNVTSTVRTVENKTDTATATSLYYAACATNNILGPKAAPDGEYIQGIANSDGVYALAPAANPYECCVLCMTGSVIANCQNVIFYDGTCDMVGGNTDVCPNGAQGDSGWVWLTADPPTEPAGGRYNSNGPCGWVGA
ncbi:uncharacterized protein AB675_11418 [Cyphellophora attinorum]|uniref:Apple domain-containing protein n=1 Tax=Cyphellophora attinorum TaxID=1664694 RepID=A0A0N1H469_9EURO|nr:uncharacterized protein AB675_11418 [Phialophora attinorum]KPI40050.1 hypothetical protein AB675_11418 [Phialophora attinorum]